MRTTTTRTAIALATALTLALTACGTDSDPDTGDDAGSGEAQNLSLRVAASPVPHADILNFVQENLAEDAGLELTVEEFDDYVLPNTALQDGEVDANFFQHQPYLDDFNEKQGTTIVGLTDVHLEPLGLYSGSLDSIDDLGEGDTIAIPDDATNAGRALQLLAGHGLITLADGVGAEATLGDITDDGGITFNELEAATLPRVLDDVDAAVINGNYALEADLSPAEDSLALEEAEGNPYANFLAVKEGNEGDEAVAVLSDLLTSDEVRQFIEETYEGSVLPAF
ncbi:MULTISPECIES: MetQ/NlpA family ABC transporter substrate-binding protein [Streptomyces]|uniref:MetQ/NlpA family ABC transporter substrate-binding protein n=1 Tax=Streptomyces TaxID=1883 RepID=UPI000CD4D999|nr:MULTISPECIES: MetQ/NlpA family ABC transporter substrate-binding protein [Streptomyces]